MTELPLERTFVDSDKVEITFWEWPVAKPTGVIQLIHGLGEHARRYDELAGVLNRAGWSVYAEDYRGHGKTGKWQLDHNRIERLGQWGEGGLKSTIQAIAQLTDLISNENPDKPLVVYGHSLGGIIMQNLPVETLDKFSGMIQSGSTSMRLGKPGIGNFNKIWNKTPNPTGFEWLSRDREVGAKFVADPLTFLALPMVQLGVRGSLYLSGKPNVPSSPYPVLFLLGELDPVGGIDSNKRLLGDYQKQGFEDLNLYVYDDGRHEMHNEINKEQVFEDVTAWLAERF